MNTKTLLFALVLLSAARTALAAETAGRRIAVVVGANAAAPGRAALRYAHEDASAMAQTLTEVAGFASTDVQVMNDPDPEQLLATIDGALRGAAGPDGLFLFYYSGHADGRSVYPNGKTLALTTLRERIDKGAAQVRVGIVDACRGGGWTRAKGLDAVPPFEVEMPLSLANEGSVLIASSSGIESAHESDAIRGSFFTHYLIAGLRGAADDKGDGEVTLAEAFDYAKTYTARDTSLVADEPQHPSFEINLRGRRDLPLSRLSRARALVALEQNEGPIQLVQMETGIVVLEIPSGPRVMRLAVAPGRYVVRRKAAEGMLAQEVEVRPGETVDVREGELTLAGVDYLAAKQAAAPKAATLAHGAWRLALGLGVVHGDAMQAGVGTTGKDVAGTLDARYGITDRLEWLVATPAFAYRLGDPGSTEWLFWGGVPSWGIGYSSVEGTLLTLRPAAGTALRLWPSNASVVTVGLAAVSEMQWASTKLSSTDAQGRVESNRFGPRTWTTHASAAYSLTLADTVTMNAGVDVAANPIAEADLVNPAWRSKDFDLHLTIGSVSLAARQLPLVEIKMSEGWSLDGYASVGYYFSTRDVRETYMLGATWRW